MMKKYEAPVVEVAKLNVDDIIQASIMETVEYLGKKGFEVGTLDAVEKNLFE